MADDVRILTALTTEHFGLAGARSQAASESSSRSALYLGTVSSALIGLGLTAQVSGKHLEVFHVFALVALPAVFALGVFTFVRLVELGIEDFLLGRAINRVRHYYLELADGATKYFMLSGNDDAAGVMANMGLEPSTSQLYFTAAMAVGVVNAIVGGSAVSVGIGVASGASLAVSVPVGGALAVLIVIGAARYQRGRRETGTRHPILFPSGDAPKGT
jgi:MFS family permease